MHMFKSRVLSVLVGAAVVVGAANLTAYATNGHAFVLGAHNNASKTTSLSKSGKGPALSLHTQKKSPPFAVNSSKVVKHLNAAQVGGKNATKLQNRTIQFHIARATALPFTFALNGVPKGLYAASFDMVIATASANPSICYFINNGVEKGLGYGAVNTGFSVPSASALVKVTAGQPLKFTCNTGTAIWDGPGYPSTITLLRIDRNRNSSITAARNHSARGVPGR